MPIFLCVYLNVLLDCILVLTLCLILSNVYLVCMDVLPACMSVYRVHAWPPLSSESPGFPGPGLTDDCELLCHARNPPGCSQPRRCLQRSAASSSHSISFPPFCSLFSSLSIYFPWVIPLFLITQSNTKCIFTVDGSKTKLYGKRRKVSSVSSMPPH